MKLTAKQEKFCQAIADGMNQSDAYRSAYNASNMKLETVNSKAYELSKNGQVAARVAELRKAISDKILWTREKSVSVLAEIAEQEKAKAGEKVSAVKELNAMHGFLAPTKHEVDLKVVVNVHFD